MAVQWTTPPNSASPSGIQTSTTRNCADPRSDGPMTATHQLPEIDTALAPLVGLRLWKANRSANLVCFHFGQPRTVPIRHGPRAGAEAEVGEYALHVQCAWRVRGPAAIVVASRDRCYPPGQEPLADPGEDWDYDPPGASRLDERIRQWLEARAYLVERVTGDTTGVLVVNLADGYVLDVFPDISRDDEYSEHWRLLRPGDLESHLVLTGRGIEVDPE